MIGASLGGLILLSTKSVGFFMFLLLISENILSFPKLLLVELSAAKLIAKVIIAIPNKAVIKREIVIQCWLYL
jgi:hypothetical protein